MGLPDVIQADAAVFAANDFGESIQFHRDGGPGTAINAVVFRQEPDMTENVGRFARVEIKIPVGALTDPPTTNDRLTLAVRLGDSAELVRIIDVAARDRAFWTVRVGL